MFDAADADAADLALGAQSDHLGQLAVQVDRRRSIATAALGTEEPQVDHVDPLHLEAPQVGLDPGSQLVGPLRGDPAAPAVTLGADLGDQHQVLRVGVKRGVDQLVGDVGTVILGRVDVVDAELDGPAQHRECHEPDRAGVPAPPDPAAAWRRSRFGRPRVRPTSHCRLDVFS